MAGYRWICTEGRGLLKIKHETEHCNGTRNATPYMALVGKAWKRIYLFEDSFMACYIKCHRERIRVYLYD